MNYSTNSVARYLNRDLSGLQSVSLIIHRTILEDESILVFGRIFLILIPRVISIYRIQKIESRRRVYVVS